MGKDVKNHVLAEGVLRPGKQDSASGHSTDYKEEGSNVGPIAPLGTRLR